MFSKVKILVIMNINKFKEAIMVRNINDEISRIKDEEKSLYELNICLAEFEKRKKKLDIIQRVSLVVGLALPIFLIDIIVKNSIYLILLVIFIYYVIFPLVSINVTTITKALKEIIAEKND